MNADRHIARKEDNGKLKVNHNAVDILLRRVRQGDAAAFGEIYASYIERIYRYVYYQVKDRMLAEDIAEEVFLKAWRNLDSYKGNGASLSSWLYRIAHNLVIDNFRAGKKLAAMKREVVDDTDSPQHTAESNWQKQRLLEVVDTLPEQQKQLILLKFIEGMNNEEIAQVTGKTQGAIRIMQMRALASLRQRLGNNG
jgi:RNA polymerase sigma-70 factor (ECF subfamily)